MQIAEILNITYDNARKRISKAKIKPITNEAIYPIDTPDKIREAKPVGRPRKAQAPEKAASKGKKA